MDVLPSSTPVPSYHFVPNFPKPRNEILNPRVSHTKVMALVWSSVWGFHVAPHALHVVPHAFHVAPHALHVVSHALKKYYTKYYINGPGTPPNPKPSCSSPRLSCSSPRPPCSSPRPGSRVAVCGLALLGSGVDSEVEAEAEPEAQPEPQSAAATKINNPNPHKLDLACLG